MKNILKIVFNFIFGLIQKRPKRVHPLDIYNSSDYEKYHGTKVINEVIDEGLIKLNPVFFDEDKVAHFKSFNSIIHYSIINSPNSGFQFNRNFVIDPSFSIIYQGGVTLYQIPICYQYLKKSKFINGTIAYLSNSNVNNYGHWVQYTLPNLYFYWKHIGKENIDYYYVGDIELKKFHIESLEYLGVSKDQIINFPCKGQRSLVCIKSNPVQFNYASYNDCISFNFLKTIQINMGDISDENSPKKIYISRGVVKYRKVIDEEWIINFLKDKGFFVCSMDGLSLREQAVLFYNATEIIAPHGSALTNIMYCQTSVKLLELFPFNYPDWFNVSFAAHAKTNYFYLFGQQTNPNGNPPIYNDIFIEKEKFIRFYNSKFLK